MSSQKKTKGIVLRKTNYSETSLILQLLTPEDGVKSFMFQGAKRKNKKGGLVQPLAILSVEYYQRQDSDLAKITTVEHEIVYRTIPYDPYKSSIVFFLNEVINHSLKEQDQYPELYFFLENILQVLDLSEEVGNFPIKFLLQFTKYLGFYPSIEENARYFDLRECTFTKYKPNHSAFLSESNSLLLLSLSGMKFDGINDPKFSLKTRRELIYDLLKYYHIIFDNFKPIQSLAVLEATLHD